MAVTEIARANPVSPVDKMHRLMLLSAGIGSVLEMYDFVIYGFFATVIAQLFFPASNHNLALVATFVIFAVGYFSRPLGGWLFGAIADKRGRKAGLLWSVVLMGVPIFLMGVLPTFAQIGYVAPVLLLLLRFAQGLSVGGEFPASVVYLGEHAPNRRRGLWISLMFFGVNMGVVVGSIVSVVLTHVFSHVQVLQFAWRIPFILGGLLALVAYVVRCYLPETQLFDALKLREALIARPLSYLLKKQSRALLQGAGSVAVMACVIGSQFLFMPTFLTHFCHFSLSQALWINTVNVLFFTCCVPFAGRLSDQLGRVPVILVGTLALMLISYPLYGLIDKQDLGMTLWALLAMGFFASLIVGPMGALLVSLFPTEVRTTGVAMTYNLSFAVFGGLAPLVLTTLQAWTQQGRSVSFYLLLCGFVALCALLSLVSPWRALERNSDALD